LVFGHHRIGARRIHDIEVAQKGYRQVALRQLRRSLDRFVLGPVTENVNTVGRGQHIHLGKLLAEKRVEQG
jgi:hypothetical protein